MKKVITHIILNIISLACALSLLQSKPVMSGVIFGVMIATGVVYALRWYTEHHNSED